MAADEKKTPATKTTTSLADAVLKTGTVSPETPVAKAAEIVQNDKPVDFGDLFRAFTKEFSEKFDRFTEAVDVELREQRELLQQARTPTAMPFLAEPLVLAAGSDLFAPDASGTSFSAALPKWRVRHPNHEERVVEAGTEKEAHKKYLEAFGIISTPHSLHIEQV